jgi:hypothetical protein
MIVKKKVKLLYLGEAIEARIVTLSKKLLKEKMMGQWWEEDCLKTRFEVEPIDREWNWSNAEIMYEGRALASVKVAIVTGAGKDLAVQGAMMISIEQIPSAMEAGKSCLLLELLFTAPRNRPELRKDGQPFVVGVGTQLLIWAAWLSRELGHGGRLRLDSSPDFVAWYERKYLQRVALNPIVFEGTAYTPMELSDGAAGKLLAGWE